MGGSLGERDEAGFLPAEAELFIQPEEARVGVERDDAAFQLCEQGSHELAGDALAAVRFAHGGRWQPGRLLRRWSLQSRRIPRPRRRMRPRSFA